MRVISQKDMPVIIDLPYERIGVSRSYEDPNYIIGFDTAASDDDCFYLARYSTPEKAEKAMQKLHECYAGVLLMQNVSLPEEGAEQLKNMTTGFICINNREDNVKIEPMHTVFRFPQEDEI